MRQCVDLTPVFSFTTDDVAVKAGKEGTLKGVTFYYDGKRVNNEPVARMAEVANIVFRGHFGQAIQEPPSQGPGKGAKRPALET